MKLRPSDAMDTLSSIMTPFFLGQRSTYRRHTRLTNLIAPSANRMCSNLCAECFWLSLHNPANTAAIEE